jgi:hypothetical protein
MATFLTIKELIELVNLGSGDILGRNEMRYLKNSKFINEDLKLNVLKMPNRQFFHINKRTNSITLPVEYTQVSSVNLVDKYGNFFPVWRNERITGDIVDIGASIDCSCEYKCGYKLCNTIKGYESTTEVITDKLPDNTDISFTCVTRKLVDRNGNFIEQKQYPQRVYESGVWTDTILYTEDIRLCKVELDHNGCVCDTEENIDAVCNTCCSDNCSVPFGGTADIPPCEGVDTWKYYCNSKLDWFWYQCGCDRFCHDPFRDVYNISEDGNRLIFPSNFGFDKVLIRWYGTTNTADIKVPLIAVDAFAAGLMWWDVRFDKAQQNLAVKFEADYTRMKWGLFSELNKRRIAEYRMIFTPPVFMPSYITGRYFNNNNSY